MCGVKRIELPSNPSGSGDNSNSSHKAAATSGTLLLPISLPAVIGSSSSSSSDAPAVQIGNGSFAWDASSQPVLSEISLAVPKGALVIVVGPVGSGKSSLLSAVLGEMAAVGQQQQQDEEEPQQQQQQQQRSPVTVAGSVAYTAQVRLLCICLAVSVPYHPSSLRLLLLIWKYVMCRKNLAQQGDVDGCACTALFFHSASSSVCCANHLLVAC
jgi:hypothetical protein